jgi:SfnB family sulfur acquisition oxidoreductase
MTVIASLSLGRHGTGQSPAPTVAERIATDTEALAAARSVAPIIAKGAALRDRERTLPYAELDLISQAGLFALTVPHEFGGADVSAVTLAEVFAVLSAADTAIGQVPQSHYYLLEALRLEGTEAQRRHYFGQVLAGQRIANALAEVGTRTARDITTRVQCTGSAWELNGKKFYCTGALFAHALGVVALDEQDQRVIAFVPRDTPGIELTDDWTGFGQRTTGSGTTLLEAVPVSADAIVPLHRAFSRPTRMGPFAQLMHAAIDLGAARAALVDTVAYVATRARPWADGGVARAAEDPYTIAAVGEVRIRLAGAEALVRRAARAVEAAKHDPSAEDVASASIAVAEAKVAATEVSLLAGSKLIELGGASATLAAHNFDRHWRNARTHTVHDPARWKLHAIGQYWLNGIAPPRHGTI